MWRPRPRWLAEEGGFQLPYAATAGSRESPLVWRSSVSSGRICMSDPSRKISRRLWNLSAGILLATVAAAAPANGQGQARDPWVVVESTSTERPFIAKILNRDPVSSERVAHTRLLRITWSYSPAANGLPREPDLRRIALLEDGLSEALGEGLRSKLVMSETGDGGRLWLFYVSDSINIEAAIRQVSQQLQAHLFFSTVNDPAWSHLRDVRARVK